jgi:hypothetical protein
MKVNDKIILYLDNQMSEEEKLIFENELKNSNILQKELEDYKNFLNEITEQKNILIEEDYFSQMIPKLKGRIEERKKLKLIPKLAFGVTTVAAVLVVFFFTFTNKSIKNEITSMKTENVQNSNNEFGSILGNGSNQINIGNLSNVEAAKYDSVFNAMISNALSLSPQSINYLSADNNTELSNMLQGINQKEANDIYNQLLHKKIF